MKKLALALMLVTTVCTAGRAEPLQVVVSILPQKYFVERIARDLTSVSVMVGPGASPATYEPKPRQMASLSKASIYFAMGVPFETAWLPRFAAVNPSMRIVHTEKKIEKMPMAGHSHGEEHHGEDHGHAEHGQILDPHVWLSPILVKKIAVTIREGLAELDPENADIYAENCADFLRELDILHREIQTLLGNDSVSGGTFFVFHPSWGYFARTYGLEQVAIEVSGGEPSPRELTELIQMARAENIRAVFVQPQFSQRAAQAIADALDIKLVTADPLAYAWSENLLEVAEALRDALP